MRRPLLLLLLMVFASCDSDTGDPAPDPASPAGTFAIAPIWFRLSQVVAPEVGGVEDLQAWVDGEIVLSQSDGTLTGTGHCTVRRRRHKAWLGETTDTSETLPFTAAGTMNDGKVILTLQGCAWAMARYTGTFSDGRYDLRLGDLQSAPVWPPRIWSDATPLGGDDPRSLVMERD